MSDHEQLIKEIERLETLAGEWGENAKGWEAAYNKLKSETTAEIERLRGRVAELEAGFHRTADGVPILPEMKVWVWVNDRLEQMAALPLPVAADAKTPAVEVWWKKGRTFSLKTAFPASQVFATPEAAQAAVGQDTAKGADGR